MDSILINFAKNYKLGKDKLKRFAELETFERVLQPDKLPHNEDHSIKGNWHSQIFNNTNPIVLEVGCGRGEYTVDMAQRYPNKNFIGIDIKGARLWRGAKTCNEKNIMNAAFLRIRLEKIESYFAPDEVSEIWITFPDPHFKLHWEERRLTSVSFLNRYRNILKPNGIIHLKTDNMPLYNFSKDVAVQAKATIIQATDDLYNSNITSIDLNIKTTYENMFLSAGSKIAYLAIII